MKHLPLKVGAGLLALALPLSLAACAGPTGESSSSALTIAVPFDVTNWNPALTVNPAMEALYDNLIDVGLDGSYQPNVATSWEWDAAATTLTITLRDDVVFTDGTPVTADSVVTALQFQKDSGANGYDIITGMTVVDAHTVALTVASPNPGLVAALAESSEIVEPAADPSAQLSSPLVGTGPYTYDATSSVTGSSLVFQRNADYWNKAAWDYDRITLSIIGDANARFNAVQSGQADALQFGTPAMVKNAEGAGLTVEKASIDWLGYNISDWEGKVNAPLGNKLLRQAIFYALDRDALLQTVDLGMGTLTNQVFPTTSDAYVAALDDVYSYDPAKAKELVVKAGYPDGVTVPIPASEADRPYQPLIEQNLKDVGITVQWQSVPLSDYFNAVDKYGVFSMRLSSSPSAYFDAVRNFGTSSVLNQNDEVDQTAQDFLEKARLTSDEAERNGILQQLNAYMVDQATIIPWYRVDAIAVTNSKVTLDFETAQGSAMGLLRNYHPAK
ncbi:peptide/nickel transport system substrate-binding protein [Microbacterium sp. SORGH_AS 1204]|uniref:ABC transporter substrate-binding protein n=1 Tax=Microbacterium sp. SORGH_AS_1204 TaxID=3041785 RepID=UPI002793AF6D|nr:ABC transporter substrate-binding protein [Microbacterium sp. SORGH_AS_1204]MDQ1136303.1 peptide/nickel transport system substrate-binding protein [Microbacterium sp. SORGH_AS_1204]